MTTLFANRVVHDLPEREQKIVIDVLMKHKLPLDSITDFHIGDRVRDTQGKFVRTLCVSGEYFTIRIEYNSKKVCNINFCWDAD